MDDRSPTPTTTDLLVLRQLSCRYIPRQPFDFHSRILADYEQGVDEHRCFEDGEIFAVDEEVFGCDVWRYEGGEVEEGCCR